MNSMKLSFQINKITFNLEAVSDFTYLNISGKFTLAKDVLVLDRSTVPTLFLALTVSVIVRVRGKLVRLELEETC